MENIEQERHSWIKMGVIMLFMIAYGVLNVIGGSGDIDLNLDDPNTMLLLKILQVISVIIVFILPAVLFSVFWTKQKIHYSGITKLPAVSSLFIGGLGMLFALPIINWLAELNQHMQLPEMFSGIETWMKNSENKAKELTEAFTKGSSVSSLILNLFVIAFMAALSEELFFRGILQKVSIECFKNKHAGVWFGAILFSAFHMQFYGFVPRMLMGAYLGYLFLWSGSLWLGIFAHFLNNGMAVFVMWLMNRNSIKTDVDNVGIQDGEFVFVFISAIFVIGSLFWVYKIEKKRIAKKEELQLVEETKNY